MRISGSVELKESGAGIPGLLIEVYDLDASTPFPAVRAAALSEDRDTALSVATGRRVGGVVTDRAGAFQLTYDTGPAVAGSPEGRRPSLFLVVVAPEVAGDDAGSKVLHASSALRSGAGQVEQYLIRLSADQLTAAGLPVPAGTTTPVLEQPEFVVHDVEEALQRQIKLTQQMRLLAAEQVSQARDRSQQVETKLGQRLIERLTNVPTELADQFGLVRPDATRQQIEAATWKTVAGNVDQVVNKQAPVLGYIQVPDAKLDDFKTPNGEFRDDLTPEVEPYLFGDATAGGRTVERIREDPVGLARRGEGQSRSLDEALEEDEGGGGGNGLSDEDPNATPVTLQELKVVLGRLVRDVTSPEAGLDGGQPGRPTQDDIQKGTDAFAVRGGPADVPAVYDFTTCRSPSTTSDSTPSTRRCWPGPSSCAIA
jgi:hypothetical protein